MARPKGSKNKPKTDGPQITSHDNVAKPPLTDEQLEALTASHVEAYSKALTRKKEADAALKNVCKVAKSEGVLLADIKAYIDAGTEEGQERLTEQAVRFMRVARWRGFPLGHQAGLFDETPASTPARSFTLGKEAGLAGKTLFVPTNCNIEEFTRGWHEAQHSMLSKVKPLEASSAFGADVD